MIKNSILKLLGLHSLDSLLSLFTHLSADLQAFATRKLDEANKNEDKARELMVKVEEAERQAEKALDVAKRIEDLVGL